MTVSVKQPLKLKSSSSHSLQQQQQRNTALGRQGEQRALQFLISQKYSFIAQNVRVGHDELDLIVQDPITQEVVIVEVKTRSSSFYGDPSLAVEWHKLRAVSRGARTWLRTVWRKRCELRIDVIAIFPGKIEHMKNVSW